MINVIIDFLKYCTFIIFSTIGVITLCGVFVALCQKLFIYFIGRSAGRAALSVLSIVGTPVHELGHIIMCVIGFHKITEVKLWQPADEKGVTGYVKHIYSRRNPYQRIHFC